MAETPIDPPEVEYMGFVKELIEKDRFTRTPDERTFLERLANIALTRNVLIRGEGIKADIATRLTSFNIFKALHDFDSLRRLTEDDYFTKIQIMLDVEEFEEVCHLIDLETSSTNLHSLDGLGARERIFFELKTLEPISAHAQHYKEKHGYGKYSGGFFPYNSASAMSQLRQDYDLAIPIAGGGLNCGSLAELFGLETRVIEIHAHDREVPTSKFVDDIRPEDIRGKRILLLDKDIVSGASLKEAIRILAPYQPAAIGTYLTIPVTEAGDPEAIEELEGMGLIFHHPENMQLIPALEMFYELNERLDTPLGQLRKVIREFKQEVDRDRHINPEATDVTLKYIDDQERMYFALNHHLPGMAEVRARITSGLKGLLDLYRGKKQLAQIMPSTVRDDDAALGHALTYISMAVSGETPLLEEAAEELARGRYHDRGLKLAEEHEAQHEYSPHSYTAAFHTAKRALADGYDAALIVGPEGFSFQPIFEDLDVPTVAINIPEADFDGERTLVAFDDLSQLKGKRVLVVEDDVRSGATLKKVLEALEGHRPAHLGIFLGSYSFAQKKENIPAEFKDVYSTDTKVADGEIFIEHLQNRENLFKRKLG